MPDEGKAIRNEKVKRGQTLRVETGRDRSDDKMGYGDTLHSDIGGSSGDITHSIKNGKVPEDE